MNAARSYSSTYHQVMNIFEAQLRTTLWKTCIAKREREKKYQHYVVLSSEDVPHNLLNSSYALHHYSSTSWVYLHHEPTSPLTRTEVKEEE